MICIYMNIEHQKMMWALLLDWNILDDIDVQRLKRLLLPDDDIEFITIKVTDHPNINNSTHCVYIEWFDIEVFENGRHICDCVVFPSRISYIFSGLSA